MKTWVFILLLYFSSVYSFDELPELRWVKPVSEITISPRYILEYTKGAFLCAGGDKIAVISADDGNVIRTVSGFNMNNGITHGKENGYVLVGGNKVTLLDSALDTLWSRPVFDGFTLTSAVQTSDSGFAALGKTNDTTVLVIKTDRDLDTLWTKAIPHPHPGNINSDYIDCFRIVETGAGYTACGPVGGDLLWVNWWISKYSYSGEHEWTKIIYGFTAYDMIPVEYGAVLTGRLDSGAKQPQENSSNSSLAKMLRFVPKYASFVHIGIDGKLSRILTFNEGYVTTVRKYEKTFIIASYFFSYSNITSREWSFIAAIEEDGRDKWDKYYADIESPVTPRPQNNNPIAQPLSSGDLVVFADSLYYYSNTTGSNQKIKTPGKADIEITGRHLFCIFPGASSINISLCTLDGRIIHSSNKKIQPSGKHSFSLEKFAKGAYIIKVTPKGQKTIQRRVIVY